MTTLIVGAGASGLVLAIKLKLNNLNHKVIIIDKNNKPGRKLSVTGNGKCNIGNINLSSNYYRNKVFSDLVFNKYDFKAQCDFFECLGIKTKMIHELCYPFSESAKTFVDYLYSYALEQGVEFRFEEELIDYLVEEKSIKAKTNKNVYKIDNLVFGTGGKSYSKFGSDGKIFDILKSHKYQISKMYPGLCPIKTKEVTKIISGMRLKANVSLLLDNKISYEENGEVLFKDDGLSGIAIFNTSSIIARNINNFNNANIVLDLFPDMTLDELTKEFMKKSEGNYFNILKGYFVQNVASYILKRANLNIDLKIENKKDIVNLAKICKNFAFTYKDLYDFENAQVTIGGLSINNLGKYLESNIENNVYFVGEIIDNDGLCGGFNLMWAFGSALYLGDNLCK
ncbi:MAG: aminoacetone oxidase family FAD-binding enzyme [Erysipelotrichales bacterium]|nr:aminoacetone oxidase family FAD-binding enzyme [Erysipelotrichales bacterium]